MEIEIRTDFIKLDSFLKFCGECPSGGEAKELVLSGAVSFNGAVCTERGKKLRNGDTVKVGRNVYTVKQCT